MPGYCLVKARPITSAVSVSTWAIYQVMVPSLRAACSSAARSARAERAPSASALAAPRPAIVCRRVRKADIVSPDRVRIAVSSCRRDVSRAARPCMWQTFFSAQGIERDGAVRDVECAQQLLRGGDLVRLFRDI